MILCSLASGSKSHLSHEVKSNCTQCDKNQCVIRKDSLRTIAKKILGGSPEHIQLPKVETRMTKANVLLADSNLLLREGLKSILAGSDLSVVGEVHNLSAASTWLMNEKIAIDLLICDPADDVEQAIPGLSDIVQTYPRCKIVIFTRKLTDGWLAMSQECGLSGVIMHDMPPEAMLPALEVVLLGGQVLASQSLTEKLGPGFAFPPKDTKPSPAGVARKPIPAAASPHCVPVVAARNALEEALYETKDKLAGPTLAKGIHLVAPISPTGSPMPARDEVLLSGRERQILNCLKEGLSNKCIARNLNIAEATVKVHLKSLLRKMKVSNRTQAAMWAVTHDALADLPTVFGSGFVDEQEPDETPVEGSIVTRYIANGPFTQRLGRTTRLD